MESDRSAQCFDGVNDASSSRLGAPFAPDRHSPQNWRICAGTPMDRIRCHIGGLAAMALTERRRRTGMIAIATRLVQISLPVVLLSASTSSAHAESDRCI